MTTQHQFPKHWPALGVIFLSILVPYIFASFFVTPEDVTHPENIRMYIFLGEFFIIIPSLIYLLLKKYPVRTVYRFWPAPAAALLWAAVFGLSISVLGDELDRLIALFIKPPDWLADSSRLFLIHSVSDAVLIIGSIVIVAGLSEELLFRGFLQTTLEFRTQDVTKAVLLTALAFAMLHMNTWWILQIYLFGVALSYLSWRTQSIFPGVVTHMGINGMAILFTNLDAAGELGWYEMGDHVSVVWLLLAGGGFYFSILGINKIYPLAARVSRTIQAAPPGDNGSEE